MTYTVKKGDTLSAIAEKFYGKARKWRTIAKDNQFSVVDPNSIQIGQTLSLRDSLIK